MTLTPRTIRTDLKCGKGAIRQGQKCTKGAATPVENALKVGGLVGGVASLGYGIYAASKGNYKKAHQAFAAGHGFTALSSSGMAMQGRRTKNKNMQRQGEFGLAVNAALAGSNIAGAKHLYDSVWAEGFTP